MSAAPLAVDAARDKIIAALKSAVGAGVAVGALTDKTAGDGLDDSDGPFSPGSRSGRSR